MNKKFVIIISAMILIGIAFVGIYREKRNEDNENYFNFFEYAVDLNHWKYDYAPQRLKYGMTVEEVLKVEKLDTANWHEQLGVILIEKTLVDVIEGIEEIEFKAIYYVDSEPEIGLFGVKYMLILDANHQEIIGKLLYEQAIEYMPKVSSGNLEDIISKECLVTWEDKKSVSQELDFSSPQSRASLRIELNEANKLVVTLGANRICRK